MRVTHHHLVPLAVLEPQPVRTRSQSLSLRRIGYKYVARSEKNAHIKGSVLMSLRSRNYCLHVQRTVLFGCLFGFLAVLGLVVAMTSAVAERGPWGTPASVVVARGLQSTDSKAVVRRLSCSTTYGIFLHLGSNPCLLRGQTNSHPPYHQRSPRAVLFM